MKLIKRLRDEGKRFDFTLDVMGNHQRVLNQISDVIWFVFKKVILAAVLDYERKQSYALMSHKTPLLRMGILIITTTYLVWGLSFHCLPLVCRKKTLASNHTSL